MLVCACTGPTPPPPQNRSTQALVQGPGHVVIGEPDLTIADGRVVIQGRWGAGPSEFGKRDEASRPGPMSLAVSLEGTIYVLDQVNQRVKRYHSSGTLLGQITIASEATEDIALAAGDRLWALVFEPGANPGYRLERYSTSDDTPVTQVKLSRSIQLATGIFVAQGTEVWVEQRHDRQTRAVELGGRSLPPDAQRHDVLGRPDRSRAGLRLSALRTGPREARVLSVVPGETTRPLLVVETPLPLVAIHALTSDKRGGVYLGLLMGRPGPDGSLSQVRKVMLAVHGKRHQVVELAEHQATDAFRPLAVSPDGAIYQLHTTEEGVTVRRWSLPSTAGGGR